MKCYKLIGRKPVSCSMFDCVWDIEQRQLCFTRIGQIEISTVFLCFDHKHTRKGPPVLFETMVFAPEDDEQWEGYMSRYCHYSEAVQGHNDVVDRIHKLIDDSAEVVSEFINPTKST